MQQGPGLFYKVYQNYEGKNPKNGIDWTGTIFLGGNPAKKVTVSVIQSPFMKVHL